MSKQLKKILRLKEEMNDVFSDVEKIYYPMRDQNSESQPFSAQYIKNIKMVALNIEEAIKTVPNNILKKDLAKELEDLLYVDFMKERKPALNTPIGGGLGHYHFQNVKPLLKRIVQHLCDYFDDDTVELQSAADRAFVHLQKSIIVNKVQKEEWESTWNDQNLETRFEKLGDSHLLSHNIWSAKFNTEGARTDLVLRDPTFETVIDPNDSKYKMSIGLLLTEWKVCRAPKTVDKLIEGAIQQAKQYCTTHFSRFEFARLCYIVIVSKDYLKEMDTSDRLIDGIIFRIVNIACIPSVPSNQSKKT